MYQCYEGLFLLIDLSVIFARLIFYEYGLNAENLTVPEGNEVKTGEPRTYADLPSCSIEFPNSETLKDGDTSKLRTHKKLALCF